jgi:membrane-bound metal-dependent hydrolase YbcI (DUF457 family)
MQRSTHVIGGAATGVFLCAIFPLTPIQIAAGILLATVCGFLPDQIQTSVPYVRLKLLEGHRGYSHTALFAMLAGGLVAAFNPVAGIFVFCGLFSHYLLDLPSEVGIPLWYPIVRRRIRLNWFNNKGRGEFITRILLLVLIAILVVR